MPLSAADFDPFDPKCDPQTQELGQTSLDIINDVMTGNAFQNPVGTITQTARAIVQDNSDVIQGILDDNEGSLPGEGLGPETVAALQGMNSTLSSANETIGFVKDATDRMSGAVNTLDANAFNQNNIVSLSDTFNSMKANLRLPGQDVIEDNFSQNFGLMFEDGGLGLMQSMGASNNILQQTLGSFLGGDIQENELVQQLTDLGQNITDAKNGALNIYNQTLDNIDQMKNMVQKYGVANTLIAAVRSNPCWTGQLLEEFAVPGLQDKLDALKAMSQGTALPAGTFSIPSPELPEAPPFVEAAGEAIGEAKAKANELAEEVGNAIRSVQSGIEEFKQEVSETISAAAKSAIEGLGIEYSTPGYLAMSRSEAYDVLQRTDEARDLMRRLGK